MPPPPERAAGFLGALAATGYMFPLIKGTEVIAGALLLANRNVRIYTTNLNLRSTSVTHKEFQKILSWS